MLERYNVNLERLKPRLELAGIEPTTDEKTRVDKACLETFGMDFKTLTESIGKEM